MKSLQQVRILEEALGVYGRCTDEVADFDGEVYLNVYDTLHAQLRERPITALVELDTY